MKRIALCGVVVLGLGACAAEDTGDLAPQPPGPGQSLADNKTDAKCPIVPAHVMPSSPSEVSCAPLGDTTNALLADINQFWMSQTTACACGPDFPQSCTHNAFGTLTGWMYTSDEFIATLIATRGVVTARSVLAHEFGHLIQGMYGKPELTQPTELQADCYSGYYLGSLVCRGLATEPDLVQTLANACIAADGTGDPIADLQTHGTCEQRASALAIGIHGYLTGTPALAACRI
ncbi:MAG TPA: hypothetical protein VFQ53_01515 [Kofleriaceae bacterium]|nr:hypothetical protein [Kofleriaceae bacterium]